MIRKNAKAEVCSCMVGRWGSQFAECLQGERKCSRVAERVKCELSLSEHQLSTS